MKRDHKRVVRDLDRDVERIVVRRLHEIRVRIDEAAAERDRYHGDETQRRRHANKSLALVHQFCRLAESLIRLRRSSVS